MCWILFICKWSTSYIESKNQSGSPKKNICWYGTQKLPRNLNNYLRNYQTETAIFLATKHKKAITASSYLNFSIQKIHQNGKSGGFCEDLLSENDFEAVLVNICCYVYGGSAFEAVQKISTRALLELCQLTKTANFKATPMKKHI